MQPGTGGFSGSPQAFEAGAAIAIDSDSTNHIVGSRPHWDRIAGNIQAKFGDCFGDPGKTFSNVFRAVSYTHLTLPTKA